jgi:hypothetical protein
LTDAPVLRHAGRMLSVNAMPHGDLAGLLALLPLAIDLVVADAAKLLAGGRLPRLHVAPALAAAVAVGLACSAHQAAPLAVECPPMHASSNRSR